jgi:bifunctional non-homologous end joining protein LigD
MPTVVHPMLALSVEKPFDSADWLFEIKWDGYRAVAFIEDGKVHLVSRNQNDLTAQFSELQALPKYVKAKTAILDGEIVALDESGRSSFSSTPAFAKAVAASRDDRICERSITLSI